VQHQGWSCSALPLTACLFSPVCLTRHSSLHQLLYLLHAVVLLLLRLLLLPAGSSGLQLRSTVRAHIRIPAIVYTVMSIYKCSSCAVLQHVYAHISSCVNSCVSQQYSSSILCNTKLRSFLLMFSAVDTHCALAALTSYVIYRSFQNCL
jgi:hypothetical protein